MKIPIKKHKKNHYSECIQEAMNTYFQLVAEVNEYGLSAEQIENLNIIQDRLEHNLNSGEYEVIECLAEELDKYKPLHSSVYAPDDGVPERIYSGYIVVVEDYSLKDNLVIDGNHRRNTLINSQPKQPVAVLIVQGDLGFRYLDE